MAPWRDDNAPFFARPLPGRDESLGSPGGAGDLGKVAAGRGDPGHSGLALTRIAVWKIGLTD